MAIPFGCGSSSRTTTTQQRSFSDGDKAVNEFIAALRQDDKPALRAIFGPQSDDLLNSGDPDADRFRREQMVKAYDQRHTLEQQGDTLVLVVGENEWPFPIPLVKQGRKWVFDTAAGKEEIIDRRVGRNELYTIQVMGAIVDAQREYARQDHDGDGVPEYAQKFRSDPGSENGLYWPTGPEQPPSPLGSLVAQARQSGYLKDGVEEGASEPRPYFGYYFKMLTAQGPDAPGGVYDYIVRGKMIGGFAVLAYPAQYGSSGVMTFIVNHDGRVYQKDLGYNTEQLAQQTTAFDPDSTWTPVPESQTNLLLPQPAD
ncbi:MAG: DUF2950 domain-containing protein [Planctomycetaceae bacterium]|nr:DUF2950 domain-containing protein [Planctomycetaceae bacterium]